MASTTMASRPPRLGYLRDLGRAFGGALLFSLPMLMTMEMWSLGFSTPPERLIIFLAAAFPVLYGLAYYAGFSDARGHGHVLMDTLTALAVGFCLSVALLALFNVLEASSVTTITGQVALQAVPAAMGALIARRQLSSQSDEDNEDEASYAGELFLMLAGALYLGLNLAPTEEMRLIAYRTTPLGVLGIIALSIALLHLFVFEVGFAGQHEKETPMRAFFHFTLPGYALCLGASLFLMWVLGGADGHDLASLLANVAVLAFPAAIGAAAARLLV